MLVEVNEVLGDVLVANTVVLKIGSIDVAVDSFIVYLGSDVRVAISISSDLFEKLKEEEEEIRTGNRRKVRRKKERKKEQKKNDL